MKLNDLNLSDVKHKSKKEFVEALDLVKVKLEEEVLKARNQELNSINGFEGGQMPLHMRMPKHGFKSRSKIKKTVIKTTFWISVLKENLLERKVFKNSRSYWSIKI